MGFRGINIGSLLIILAVVLLLFGTKRLRSIGSDLGEALRSFRKGIEEKEPEAKTDAKSADKEKNNFVE